MPMQKPAALQMNQTVIYGNKLWSLSMSNPAPSADNIFGIWRSP